MIWTNHVFKVLKIESKFTKIPNGVNDFSTHDKVLWKELISFKNTYVFYNAMYLEI